MSDKKILLLGSSSFKFEEPFNTSYANPGAGVLVTNAYNGWDFYSSNSSGHIETTNGLIAADEGYSDGFTRLTRSGGYSLHRDFDISFASDLISGMNTGAWCNVSICAEPNYVGGWGVIPKGLTIRRYKQVQTGWTIQIYQNGTLLASIGGDKYTFIKKRGSILGITSQSSATPPATPAHTYTITDFTQMSNQIMCQIGIFSYETNDASMYFDDFKGTFY